MLQKNTNNALLFDFIDELTGKAIDIKLPYAYYFDYIDDLYCIRQKLIANELIKPKDIERLRVEHISCDAMLSAIKSLVL